MQRSPLPAPLDGAAAGRPPRLGDTAEAGDRLLERLAQTGVSVSTGDADRVEAGRDWWPLSTWWAVAGVVPALPAVVCRPVSVDEVVAVVEVAGDLEVPLTAFAGASGVCGGSVPVHGGISLDMTGLAGVTSVDDESLLVDVGAGTFGPDLEAHLREQGLTLGHWPQSIDLSTVGGWLACRSAGQYSTRYGKIEDMVAGLDVVLADGRRVTTGDHGPRSATGPDLTQLFVGSEGTLGIITSARLRVHPAPPAERRAAYGFASFAAGLDACRRVLRRGATPAVLRLYDNAESARQFDVHDHHVLIVVDEGDLALIDAVMSVVAEESSPAVPLDAGLAGRWLERRNHLPPLDDLVRGGLVVDTVEIAAPWRSLAKIYDDAVSGLRALDETIAASAHQSHAYSDGACLYFTFAGRIPDSDPAAAERYYRRAFDAVTAATVLHGGTISHHHGVGLNRARYMVGHLGPAFGVLQSVKDALDPKGNLNPGKLGLADRFGTMGGVP